MDIASLVAFRIAFGGLLLWDVWRYLHYGWVAGLYTAPPFHFSYLGFAWVEPWPADWLHVHFVALGVLAAAIAVGFLYRASAALFCLGFGYVFLLAPAHYNNHLYLVCLLSFLLIFLPCHRALSVDAWLRPGLRAATAPAAALWILRAQMAFVYFFAGVAKLDGDWLRGFPLRRYLAMIDLPAALAWLAEPWAGIAMSWAGMLLDLGLVPALLLRRTRPYAFAAALAFHGMNAWLFEIGIFPWLSIAMTLLFFDPSWPRRLLGGAGSAPRATPPPAFGRRQRVASIAIVAYLAAQVLLPLRQFAWPGKTSWTEQGHRFAWRQMVRGKRGRVLYLLTDPASGRSWEVDPSRLLAPFQRAVLERDPDMILQFAHHLAEQASEPGGPRVEVRAVALASLNGRPMQPLVDPVVDLAAEPRRALRAYPWIRPLETPLAGPTAPASGRPR